MTFIQISKRRPRRGRVPLACALLLLLCGTFAAAQNNDMGPLAGVAADRAFGYLSGNFRTLHNHPAMYADSATGSIVVLGNGYRGTFPIAKAADAVKAYRNLLYERGYEPDGKKRAKKKKSTDEEYRELLSLMSYELSDSVKSLFTDEQIKKFGDISPSAGYDYFSGYTGEYANHPAIYAHLYGFTIVGRGVRKEVPMKEASRALAEYVALVRGKG